MYINILTIFMKIKSLSLTEARKKIFELTEEVQIPGKFIILTQNSTPKAVLIGAEEFESLLETLDVLQSNQGILSEIKKIDTDVEKRNMKEYVPLEHLLEEQFVSESHTPYAISTTSREKKRTLSTKPKGKR